jgi:hypothetical protein
MAKRASSPELIAGEVSRIRDLLPTSLGSAELRDALAADIRARSVFVSRGANAIYLSEVKRVIDAMSAGEMNLADGRLAIMEVLRATDYTPEGGFPETPAGQVPPAVRGTLQDLSSRRRIEFVIRTQLALVRGRGEQLRGRERARQFPAWELVRLGARNVPRDWQSRWQIAGGTLVGGRMIALQGDPIWGELGASGNFEDALDVDFPPFAFNSGMGWRPIPRGMVARFGVRGPNGETPEEWLAKTTPTLIDKQPGIPAPELSLKDVDPAIVKAFEDSADIRIIESTATTPGNEDAVRRKLAERRAAREAREAALLRKSIERRQLQYEGRGA